MSQPDGGHHVQLVHLFLTVQIGFPEAFHGSEAGVVDQEIELRAVADALFGGLQAIAGGEVRGDYFDAAWGEFGRERVEAVSPARDQNQVITASGELAREDFTNSTGRAGNHSNRGASIGQLSEDTNWGRALRNRLDKMAASHPYYVRFSFSLRPVFSGLRCVWADRAGADAADTFQPQIAHRRSKADLHGLPYLPREVRGFDRHAGRAEVPGVPCILHQTNNYPGEFKRVCGEKPDGAMGANFCAARLCVLRPPVPPDERRHVRRMPWRCGIAGCVGRYAGHD